MVHLVRRHLRWRLFLSYLIVVLVGMVVLFSTNEVAVPHAFDRHMASMATMMGGAGGMKGMDFFGSFRRAVTEAMVPAVAAAFVAALVASVLVSRRIVQPVQEMMVASQRIADGHYNERVGLPSRTDPEQWDELARLALSFNQMAARLEKTEAMRQELIGDVAHELRTPLSTITGYMEGLIDGVLPAEPATFQQVCREADRLQRLVHDLQELSRVEAGAFELKLQLVPVAQLFEAIRSRLGRQFEDKGVRLELDMAAGLPPVRVDKDRIDQVLLNLVGNALQYTPEGGRVCLRARREDSQVLVTVEDTGIGIPLEHLPHLFERFYRVDKSRSRAGGGSGIGLTIAKHLVEVHGGQIQATSDGPGRGSTFSFTMPAA